MPRVTVGLPVFNGAALLPESLECLTEQSFADIEIIVSDNGSTDGTSDIAADWARRDRRIRHVRHEVTKGVMDNFFFARDAAQSPFFLWRSHDDLSAPGFIETLLGLIEAREDTILAVGNLSREYGGRRPDRFMPYPGGNDSARLARILLQLFRGRGSWYYGLWRTEACREITSTVNRIYPDPWAADYLTIGAVAFRDGIRGTRATTFRQRNIRGKGGYQQRKLTAAEMSKVNADFLAAARAFLAEAPLTSREKSVIGPLLPAFARRSCYSATRVLKARLTGAA